MKEITEEELHIYLIDKSLLNIEIQNEIENRLKTDDSIIEEFEEIKEFYNNVEQLEKENSYRIFVLTPLNIKTSKDEHIQLAAQQSVLEEQKIKYVKTFISAEKFVMVRMFYNKEQKEYEFFVLCETDSEIKNAVIQIPSLHIELITDEKGWAKLSADYLPEDVELTVIFK